jgi:hypothetical protein
MYQRYKERFGTAGVVLGVIAIVLAIGGSAIAASGLNGKQKKEVEKIAKKYAGKNGAPGAPGTPGTNGTNGTNGKDGAPGAKGENGTNGTNGTNAEGTSFTGEKAVGSVTCKEGGVEVKSAKPTTAVCNGSPWTAGGTLPSGKTETGTWNVAQFELPISTTDRLASISFPIPLPSSVEGVYLNAEETANEAETEGCKWEQGNANAKPEAPKGKLCVFAQIEVKEHAQFFAFGTPGGGIGPAGPAGVYLAFELEGTPENLATLDVAGAWAVTAP